MSDSPYSSTEAAKTMTVMLVHRRVIATARLLEAEEQRSQRLQDKLISLELELTALKNKRPPG